jgi:short subunit dehydrogenase-like uncharacterized protein
MVARQWLLYGANGYTGRLIAEHAVSRGLSPMLAGRRAEAIAPLARRLSLDYRVFDLHDRHALEDVLHEVGTVLLAAGPFSRTSRQVVDACLRTGSAYLDITGEVAVFEAVMARDAEAQSAGSVLLPGVGFDVVPSDCLAASLHGALRGATHLELAFHGGGPPSPGTLLTMLDGIRLGGAVRINGRIQREPLFARAREVPFHDRRRLAASIPWGDVSTAFYSTGIPNIVVYRAIAGGAARWLPLIRVLLPVAGRQPVESVLRRLVERVRTPDVRPSASQLWGRASNSNSAVEATLTTPQAYELTAMTAVECAQRVADGALAAGARTPSQAFGADFIAEFDGCELRISA